LSQRDAADLFAYFYAFRYFEKAGSARRGKGIFRSKHCVDCHNLAEEPGVEGASHVQWESAADLIQFTRELWNHTPAMLPGTPGRMRRGSMPAEQMNDMVVYLQNLPANRQLQRRFAPGPAETGEALFRSKGCAGCHTGSRALVGNRYGQTMAGFAAAMWDHAAATRDKVGEIRPDEMNALVGYLWSVQYFDDRGDPGRGRAVASNKRCDSCHGAPGSGAPALASFAGKLDSISFASSIWSHGPAMLRKMQADQIEWPRFRDNQLSDLLAYINAL
jgi:cytochrome c551/c552